VFDLPFSLNSEPVKWVLILASAPLWLPFFRALWKDWNDSLRDEGGLLGLTPTTAELSQLDKQRGKHRSTMLSVTWEEYERARGSAPARRAIQTPARRESDLRGR
jgi:hypothetical protein